MSNGNDNPHAHTVRQEDHDRADARGVDDLERRHMDAEFRQHMQDHLDRVDREMEAIRVQQGTIAAQLKENTAAVKGLTDLLNASKLGTSAIKYLIGVGTALIVAYAAFRGIK